MKDLKILASQKPIPTRKFSINGKVFESLYFNHLLFCLKENTLTINSYFENLISMEEILNIELSENEKVNFITMCNYYSNGIIRFEELLSSQKVNDKKVFTIDKCYSTIGKQLSSFYIDINEELEDEKVINLNFILKKLEEVINH